MMMPQINAMLSSDGSPSKRSTPRLTMTGCAAPNNAISSTKTKMAANALHLRFEKGTDTPDQFTVCVLAVIFFNIQAGKETQLMNLIVLID